MYRETGGGGRSKSTGFVNRGLAAAQEHVTGHQWGCAADGRCSEIARMMSPVRRRGTEGNRGRGRGEVDAPRSQCL